MTSYPHYESTSSSSLSSSSSLMSPSSSFSSYPPEFAIHPVVGDAGFASNSSNGSSSSSSSNRFSSTFAAICNLAVAAAGAGLLSFPYAVANQGIFINVITTIFFAFINGYTLLLLCRFTDKFRHEMRAFTLEGLCEVALGKRSYTLATITVAISQVGSLSGFLIIIGDISTQVASHMCEVSPISSCFILSSRAFLVSIFCIIIILPLSTLKSMRSLGHSSFLAAVTVILVMILVIVRGIQSMVDHDSSYNREPLLLINPSLRIMLGIPISIFALGCHCQIIPVYSELSPSDRPKIKSILVTSISFCLVLYLLTGVFGYISFGSQTNGNVLQNYSITDEFANVSRFSMALHITLAYPVILVPLMKTIEYLRVKSRNKTHERYGNHCHASVAPSGLSTGLDGPAGNQDDEANSKHLHDHSPLLNGRHIHSSSIGAMSVEDTAGVNCGWVRIRSESSPCEIAISFSIVIITALLAIFIPQVAVVFGLLGGTVSIAVMFWFPLSMLYVHGSKNEKRIAKCMGIASVFCAILATTINITSVVGAT